MEFALFVLLSAALLPAARAQERSGSFTPANSALPTDSSAGGITAPASVPAVGTVSIDANNLRQSIDGFGAAFPGAASWINTQDGPNHSGRARRELLNACFSITNGAGFSIARVEINADNHDSIYPGFAWINSIEPSEGNWLWTGDQDQVWLMQQAQNNYGVTQLFSTAWSPPPWMKYNSNYTGIGDAHVITNKYQAFADYLSRYVREYKSRFGLDISVVSMANEPSFPAWYQGCLWSPDEMVNFLKNYLKPTFINDGVTAKIMAPEDGEGSFVEHVTALLADPSAAAAFDIAAFHGYDLNWLATQPNVKAAGKRLWQTETSMINEADNSIHDGIRWAKYIHKLMTVSEVNAFVWWWAAVEGNGGSGMGLLHIQRDARSDTWRYSKRLWTIANFSRFVRPGFVRLETTSGAGTNVFTTAYKDPVGGQVVIVTINDSPSAQTLTYNFTGLSGVTTLTPYVTTDRQDLEPQIAVPVSGGSFTVTLAPNSVTTFVKTPSPLPPAPSRDTHLSTIEWVNASTGWHVPVVKDASTPSYWGNLIIPMQWQNQSLNQYTNGLGFMAPASVTYNLDGRCSTFIADLFMNAGTRHDTSVDGGYNAIRYQVWGDGRLITDLGVVYPEDPPRTVSVNVSGVKLMKLVALSAAVLSPTAYAPNDQGHWANARVIYSGGPSVSITSPTNNTVFTNGSNISVSVDAVTTSGAVTKVELFQGATLMGTDMTAPYLFTWNGTSNGDYILTAKATDSSGLTSVSRPVSVTVESARPTNQPPTINLTAPLKGSLHIAPANITLSASASDNDGSVSKVEFIQGGNLIGTVTNSPFTFAWENIAPAVYMVTAKATDNLGASSISSAATITVNLPGLGSAARKSNGTYQVTLAGTVGRTNTLLASTNLTVWTVVTNAVNTGSLVTLTDPQAAQHRYRFYQVSVEGVLATNVVGFTTVTATPGFSIVANQLVSSNRTVGEIFTGLPDGTTIYKFRGSTGDFTVNSFDGDFQLWDEPGQTFANGEAGFIFNPTSTNLVVIFQGEVPRGVLSRPIQRGYSLIGSLLPLGGLLQTDHSFPAVGGEVVYRFRNGGYLISQFDPDFKVWDSEPQVGVGEGFFLYEFATTNWIQNFSVTR